MRFSDDTTSVERFFNTLYKSAHEGKLEVRALGGFPVSMWFPLTERGFADAVQYSYRMEGECADVYFGVNPRTFGGKDDSSVVSAVALFVDIDGLGDEAGAWARLAECRDSPNPPDAAVFSGRGLHLYWRLTRPVSTESEDTAVYLRALRAICKEYGGDSKCVNLGRIMRFPGTVNRKNGEKAKVWIAD